MDDQLLPLFRDWVIDAMYVWHMSFVRHIPSSVSSSGEIASKPANPLVDSYKSSASFRDKVQDYKGIRELNRAGSTSPKQSHTGDKHTTDELGEEMTAL